MQAARMPRDVPTQEPEPRNHSQGYRNHYMVPYCTFCPHHVTEAKQSRLYLAS